MRKQAKKASQVHQDMTVFGVGPKFAGMSILFAFLIYAYSSDYPQNFQMGHIPATVRNVLGYVLIVLGIPLWILSGVTVIKGFKAAKFCTTGVYEICRHPLYASWTILIVPGIVLLSDNWLGLAIPLMMIILLKLMVREEEAWLEKRFGASYRAYKNRVPGILPIGWFKK